MNLIKLNNITCENVSNGTYNYFIELETNNHQIIVIQVLCIIVDMYIQNENGNYKISDIGLRNEDFLCAAYPLME